MQNCAWHCQTLQQVPCPIFFKNLLWKVFETLFKSLNVVLFLTKFACVMYNCFEWLYYEWYKWQKDTLVKAGYRHTCIEGLIIYTGNR